MVVHGKGTIAIQAKQSFLSERKISSNRRRSHNDKKSKPCKRSGAIYPTDNSFDQAKIILVMNKKMAVSTFKPDHGFIGVFAGTKMRWE